MEINDFASRARPNSRWLPNRPHGTLFRHFNIYNFLLDNICFQKKLVSLNIPGGAREAPISTRLKLIRIQIHEMDKKNISEN